MSDTPATFEELDGGTTTELCGRCREAPATHTATIKVSKPLEGVAGRGGKRYEDVASQRGRLCERCAVAVFATVRKALR